jgi:hypothetical protein
MTYHESPCLVLDPLHKLDEETKTEECCEEGIGSQAWIVTIKCAFDSAVGRDFHAGLWGGRWDSHCCSWSVIWYRDWWFCSVASTLVQVRQCDVMNQTTKLV